MEPIQTLHDFALNLLSDTDAMSAFESDPTGVLQAAGLGDLTAGDVQEVLPLVLDYAANPDLTSGVSDLTGSVDAVDKLDAAGLSGTDTSLGGLTATTTAMAENLTGDLTAGGLGIDDLGVDNLGIGGLDSSALQDITAGDNTVHGVTSAVSDLGVTDLGGVGDVEGTVNDVTGAVSSGDLHLTDGLDATSTITDTVGDVTGDLSVDPVTALSDVASDSGNLTGNLSQLHDVVSNVGLNGDATGIGSVSDVLGDINVGGIGNGNDVDF